MNRDLARLTEGVYDVLVIGGGIYGLFTAWDASLRGLSVALVEKGDFGQGTSSNTLRIIHGGLRYLQHGNIYRMRRSIHERTVFMRIAPHLVHPIPFLIPTYGHGLRGKEILSLALRMGDFIGWDRNCLSDPQKHLPAGRVLSKHECLKLFPGVNQEGLNGGVVYYDSQMYNSERFILSVARSAYDAGAAIANYAEVTEILQDRDGISAVKAKDGLSGDEFECRARVIVNASGPWLVARVLRTAHPSSKRVLGLNWSRRGLFAVTYQVPLAPVRDSSQIADPMNVL